MLARFLSRSVSFGSALTLVTTASCADAGVSPATRETLPNGTIVVTYPALAEPRRDTLAQNLRIGKVEGEAWETFGSIRALEVSPDGRIFVLDYQAAEIRLFDRSGSYIATVAERGEGPGEIRQANGLLLGPDGILWVQDHGARALVAFSITDGSEVARHPMLVSGYRSEWDAAIDAAGVLRQIWSYSDPTARPTISTGLHELRRRVYVKSYNPRSQLYDSIFLGEELERFLQIQQPRGYMNAAVPHEGRRISALDRAGSVWTAQSDAYRIARITTSGDTTLVVQGDVLGALLTTEDRSLAESLFRQANTDAILPERKPVLQRLYTDDKGLLWVERSRSDAEESRHLDVYDSDGEFLGAVALPVNVTGTLVIRGDQMYAVAQDDLDVSYVVRIALPAFARR